MGRTTYKSLPQFCSKTVDLVGDFMFNNTFLPGNSSVLSSRFEKKFNCFYLSLLISLSAVL